MATRVSISHALSVLECKDHHKLIDVFNTLCLMSSQMKRDWYIESISGHSNSSSENIFIIRTQNRSVCSLAKAVACESEYMHRSTVTNCIDKLLQMNILKYNETYLGWEIVSMGSAFESSPEYMGNGLGGYMDLKKLFFTKEFYEMPITMKKILYYCCILMSTKGFKNVQSFIINLKSETSKWMTFLNTDNIYYVKSTIMHLLDNGKLLKKVDQKQYSHRTGPKPKNRFLFILKPLDMLKSKFKENLESFDSKFERLKSKHTKLYDYICYKREQLFSPAKERIDKNMVYNLMDVLKRFPKATVDFVIDGVFTKLHSSTIEHPSAYIKKVLNSYVINLHMMK